MQVFTKLFFFLFNFSVVFSQSIHYSDIFKGGVCVVGTAISDQYGNCNIPFFVDSGSNIKKIFFITYTPLSSTNIPAAFENTIQINGVDILLNLNNDAGSYFASNTMNNDIVIGHQTNVYDLTNQITITGSSSINLNWNQNEAPQNCPSCRFSSALFVILYQNSNLDVISYSMIMNETNNSNSQNFNFNPETKIDMSKDVSLGFQTDRLGGGFMDGYEFFINNSSIGDIYLAENFFNKGTIGNFYYQNGILHGLDNDIADNIISGGDAILNINEYITGNSPINIKYNYIQPTNVVHNFFISSHLAHSTNCEAFPVTVSTDTTICRNETVQLSASGGTQYLWQPSTDLSCVYCPNPIFTGDSSRFYTVRIWNNDSCSVVRPVKVNVRQLPVFSSITSTPSDCNGATGKIISSANLSGETYSLNGGTPQNSGNFFNLAPGDYTLSVHELNGCTNDTVITVGSSISTNAFFTATPTQGAPPLWVNFANQSTNASNYEWFLNGISQGNNFPTYLFDTTGNYTVTLAAWPENPSCSDSFELQIYVFDSLIVQVPNVFTPNNDQSNDLFGITTNSPVTVEYQLFNRWGNEMIAGKSSLGTVTPSGLTFTPLWDGNNATEGTYFYKLTVTAQTPKGEQKRTLDGFFVLVR